ncbi:dipeptidase D [Lachnospiraceae bacterium NE2001]|nr:dipeptidase D [Lachnospiraceae bacterium NE2001]
MSVLDSLQPTKVFYFFEELCAIPHGSRNTKLISDYVVSIAKRKGLEYYQDDHNNVIVYKPACDGTGNKDITGIIDNTPVILQGHLDMVCEKTDDSDFDFSCEGLRLYIEDGYIKAEGTTLGGDDGIAVAYMLALLDSDDIMHPPLECVFTVDEEIGMLGAVALDKSRMKGKKLLNIDSEDEGHLLVSCAGGATAELHFPVLRRGTQGERYRITISGLVGGHSGVEINKGRANADILMGLALRDILFADDSLRVVSVRGGLKDNAIATRCEAVVISKRGEELPGIIQDIEADILAEYGEADPDIKITFDPIDRENMAELDPSEKLYALDEVNNLSFIMAFSSMPYGVQAMSTSIEGLVQTSLNLGILNTYENEIVMSFSVRSSVETEKQELITTISDIARSAGGYAKVEGEYPAWEYKEESELRSVMTSTYEKMFGKQMVVEAIHAGVECGLFVDGIDGLDAVSFGPNILDIHTPKERLDIDSVIRTWDYILEVLQKLSRS